MAERRVTMTDIAREAGVGIATVDRVLNGRAAVRRTTAERVLEAASRLDYHAKGLIAGRVAGARPLCRLGFILQKESKEFYRTLAKAIDTAVRDRVDARTFADVTFVDALSPEDLSRSIGVMAEKVDALGIVSIDHPSVTSAVDIAAETGCHVFAMLSPLSAGSVKGFIGIDGRKAGRTGGAFVGRDSRRGAFHRYRRTQGRSNRWLVDAPASFRGRGGHPRRVASLSGPRSARSWVPELCSRTYAGCETEGLPCLPGRRRSCSRSGIGTPASLTRAERNLPVWRRGKGRAEGVGGRRARRTGHLHLPRNQRRVEACPA